MRKGTAKNILKTFKNDCSVESWKDKPFRHTVMANVRRIFGENSVQENGLWDYLDKPIVSQNDIEIIKRHLDNFIIDVDNGVFEKDKNWIVGLSNKQIVLILFLAVMIGYVYGAYNNPNNAIVKKIKSLPFFIEEASD